MITILMIKHTVVNFLNEFGFAKKIRFSNFMFFDVSNDSDLK